MAAEWEYSVEALGGALRGVRPQEIEALLNEAANDGWEPVNVFQRGASSNQILIVLRRKVTGRTRDRSGTWP